MNPSSSESKSKDPGLAGTAGLAVGPPGLAGTAGLAVGPWFITVLWGKGVGVTGEAAEATGLISAMFKRLSRAEPEALEGISGLLCEG